MRIELEMDGEDALAFVRWLECAGMTKTVVSVMEQIEAQRRSDDSCDENSVRSDEKKGRQLS